MLEAIKKEGIVAVIRAKDHDEARGYMNACLKGGVKALEVTYTIPNVNELSLKYFLCIVLVLNDLRSR